MRSAFRMHFLTQFGVPKAIAKTMMYSMEMAWDPNNTNFRFRMFWHGINGPY